MQVISNAKELNQSILDEKMQGKTIGFVPTMGALHNGHLELIKKARNENDIVVVSVFVNPTQFNNSDDLEKYPRTLDQDLKLLEPVGIEYVFAPSVGEIYPQKDERVFDFNGLDTLMEGKFRPGHFNGVGQVVSRLFDIVVPTRAYFGEKDFQQLAIIRLLAEKLKYDIQLIPVPIVREQSGLAMSSRNARLSDAQREEAIVISSQLLKVKNLVLQGAVLEDIVKEVLLFFENDTNMEVEYFEIVDGNTLKSVENINQASSVVACIAVYCGNVRLIDNIIIKQNIN